MERNRLDKERTLGPWVLVFWALCGDEASPRSSECSALLLAVLLTNTGLCWEERLPQYQVQLHLYCSSCEPRCFSRSSTFSRSLGLCWTAPWPPFNCFPRLLLVLVVFCRVFSIFQPDLIIFCIFRDPSTLVCCTGWRQEGNECTIRKFDHSNGQQSAAVVLLLPPYLLCFPGVSFTVCMCVCSCV